MLPWTPMRFCSVTTWWWRNARPICLVVLLWGAVASPSPAEECKADIERRYAEKINGINEKINRTQKVMRSLLRNTESPDDVIRSVQQDLSRLRQQREEIAIDWVLKNRRHREPENCGRE